MNPGEWLSMRSLISWGDATAMAFRDSRRGYDLDVLIAEGHGPVIEATRRIARRRGWPESRLNEQMVAKIPKSPDRRGLTVSDFPLSGTIRLVTR